MILQTELKHRDRRPVGFRKFLFDSGLSVRSRPGFSCPSSPVFFLAVEVFYGNHPAEIFGFFHSLVPGRPILKLDFPGFGTEQDGRAVESLNQGGLRFSI